MRHIHRIKWTHSIHKGRILSPFHSLTHSLSLRDSLTVHDNAYHDQWVTVFGLVILINNNISDIAYRFPPAATSFIFEQFSQYGTIIRHTVRPLVSNEYHYIILSR